METAIAAALGLLGGPDPKSLASADFGSNWGLVIALDVINTVVVVFYVWRIWRQKLPPVRQRTQ
ncbi:MAG TPA: hypothetical protein VMU81_14090 [Acetobacteraceae bacterium]|nr:hypothetical protein [Acetobacteraceae bacterium]